jgi:hypothetical protein
VPGIDIAILVLSTNNEKTFRDLGSGFALSNAEAEAVHFKKPSSVNFALTSASLILL